MNFQLFAFCLLAVAYRAEAQCTVVAIANGTPTPAIGQEVANDGTLELVCDAGYVASAASTTCASSGSSFTVTLTCDAFNCDAAPTVTNGGGVTPTLPASPGYTGNTVVTAACASGFVSIDGANTAECTATNTWTPASLTCTATCNAAPTLTQGTFPTMPTGGYSGSVSITCNAGYITSTASASCSATNTWSPTALTCTAATCAAEPTTLTQGTFPAVPSGGYTGTVSITCNSGYKAGSTNSSLCTSTNTWDPTSVTCTAITCSALTVTNGAVAPTGTVAYNGVVTVSCNSGYTLSSTTGDLKCDGALSNNYNATTPTCTATTTVSTTAGSASLFHLHTALMAMLLSAFAFIKAL